MQKYRDKGAEILGASFDTIDENRAFAEKLAFPYRLLCDTDRRLGLAYGACDDASAAVPRRISYLIDPEGKVKQSWGTTAKLDVNKHAEEVLREIP